jgi:hypothetical protein
MFIQASMQEGSLLQNATLINVNVLDAYHFITVLALLAVLLSQTIFRSVCFISPNRPPILMHVIMKLEWDVVDVVADSVCNQMCNVRNV